MLFKKEQERKKMHTMILPIFTQPVKFQWLIPYGAAQFNNYVPLDLIPPVTNSFMCRLG